MVNKLDQLSLVSTILGMIVSIALYQFLKEPSYNSNLKKFIIWSSYIIIALFGYLLSVKIYKVINGLTSLSIFDNWTKITLYLGFITRSLYILNVVNISECQYNDPKQDEKFEFLRKAAGVDIVVSVISVLYFIWVVSKGGDDDEGQQGSPKFVEKLTTKSIVKVSKGMNKGLKKVGLKSAAVKFRNIYKPKKNKRENRRERKRK